MWKKILYLVLLLSVLLTACSVPIESMQNSCSVKVTSLAAPGFLYINASGFRATDYCNRIVKSSTGLISNAVLVEGDYPFSPIRCSAKFDNGLELNIVSDSKSLYDMFCISYKLYSGE